MPYPDGEMRGDVEDAYDSEDKEYESSEKMVTCPSCGKKFSASNQGGASVGGGT